MMNETTAHYNLLMLSGDQSIARGQDTAFYRLLERFSRYWQRIDILTPAAPDAKPCTIHGNVFVHPAPRHRLLQPLFIKQKGEQLLAEREYHLVTSHDFGFFYNGIGAYWLLRKRSIPLVSEIHHVEGYPLAVNLREKLWRWTAMRYLPFVGARAAALRVVNRQVPPLLRELGVPDEKILVLYSLYLDFDLYQPISDVNPEYDVLFVGRLASNKGILLLVDAIAAVTRTHPDVRLAIRGEGPLKAEIQAKITALNLQKNIVFLPRIADTAAMADLYRRSRMLVCASTVEGNPRVTIEAMACGVPVISTPVGIMPDVIQDGENGYLFDWQPDQLAEQIGLLLDDPDLQARVGEAGRQSVQQFDAESVIRAYAAAYHSIIEENEERSHA